MEYNFSFLSTNFMLDINLDFAISSHHDTTFFSYELLQCGDFLSISASSTWSVCMCVCVCIYIYDKIMISYCQPYNFLPTTTL